MGRHSLAKLLYTQLSICKWQGFPAYSASLCGECGFMFVRLRRGREDQSLVRAGSSESPTLETLVVVR